jgi:hypothetical protein
MPTDADVSRITFGVDNLRMVAGGGGVTLTRAVVAGEVLFVERPLAQATGIDGPALCARATALGTRNGGDATVKAPQCDMLCDMFAPIGVADVASPATRDAAMARLRAADPDGACTVRMRSPLTVRVYGHAAYAVAGRLAHACAPNCDALFDGGGSVVVRALCAIKEGGALSVRWQGPLDVEPCARCTTPEMGARWAAITGVPQHLAEGTPIGAGVGDGELRQYALAAAVVQCAVEGRLHEMVPVGATLIDALTAAGADALRRMPLRSVLVVAPAMALLAALLPEMPAAADAQATMLAVVERGARMLLATTHIDGGFMVARTAAWLAAVHVVVRVRIARCRAANTPGADAQAAALAEAMVVQNEPVDALLALALDGPAVAGGGALAPLVMTARMLVAMDAALGLVLSA